MQAQGQNFMRRSAAPPAPLFANIAQATRVVNEANNIAQKGKEDSKIWRSLDQQLGGLPEKLREAGVDPVEHRFKKEITLMWQYFGDVAANDKAREDRIKKALFDCIPLNLRDALRDDTIRQLETSIEAYQDREKQFRLVIQELRDDLNRQKAKNADQQVRKVIADDMAAELSKLLEDKLASWHDHVLDDIQAIVDKVEVQDVSAVISETVQKPLEDISKSLVKSNQQTSVIRHVANFLGMCPNGLEQAMSYSGKKSVHSLISTGNEAVINKQLAVYDWLESSFKEYMNTMFDAMGNVVTVKSDGGEHAARFRITTSMTESFESQEQSLVSIKEGQIKASASLTETEVERLAGALSPKLKITEESIKQLASKTAAELARNHPDLIRKIQEAVQMIIPAVTDDVRDVNLTPGAIKHILDAVKAHINDTDSESIANLIVSSLSAKGLDLTESTIDLLGKHIAQHAEWPGMREMRELAEDGRRGEELRMDVARVTQENVNLVEQAYFLATRLQAHIEEQRLAQERRR